MTELARLLTMRTEASAVIVGAVAHAEIAVLEPFGSGDGVVARAVEHMVLISAGVDPYGLINCEAGHAADPNEYGAALRGYRDDGVIGVRVWLQRRIDRLFYGSRQDAARAVAEVGSRLGEHGSGSTGLEGALAALCKTLRTPAAAIRVNGAVLAKVGELSGETVTITTMEEPINTVNAEIKDLFAAGADIVQIDEPWLQSRAEKAREFAIPAIDRALDGIEGESADVKARLQELLKQSQYQPVPLAEQVAAIWAGTVPVYPSDDSVPASTSSTSPA
jgi:hypothetical protein